MIGLFELESPALPRVLGTGSRRLKDRGLVFSVAEGMLLNLGPFVLDHGACQDRGGNLMGADRFLDEWGRERADAGIVVDPLPADWSQGDRGGPRRNGILVARRPVRCIAFLEPGARNKGTLNCVGQAHAKKIPITAWWAASGRRLPRAISEDELVAMLAANRRRS